MNSTRQLFGVLLAAGTLWLGVALAAEPPVQLEDETFQDQMRSLSTERNEKERFHRAQSMIMRHRLSSLQVKAICSRLSDDAARLEFALAAYPRTVDPENFYEVYDAFTSFSKVLRLHDAVRPRAPQWPDRPPVVVTPPPMTEEEVKSVIKALRQESFDNTRAQVARQIVSTSPKRFLSTQIKQMVQCFDFENARLEFAKFAFDYVQDPERYYVVNEAFDFDGSKQALARHIESRRAAPPKK